MKTLPIDYSMNEYCASYMLKCLDDNTNTPDYIYSDFIKSSIALLEANIPYGPKHNELARKLEAAYHMHSSAEGFDYGAIYGSMKAEAIFNSLESH